MNKTALHVFRNTPFGREMLMQTLYFCQHTHSLLDIYIPSHDQFMMYFQDEVVMVQLDRSFLFNPEAAREHARALCEAWEIEPTFIEPSSFTGSNTPDLPVTHDYMTCPRTISDLSAKIGLGYIGPKVRAIVNSAQFPVLIPAATFKPWKSVTVFYGGTNNAHRSVAHGLAIAEAAKMPVQLFTLEPEARREELERSLDESRFRERLDRCGWEWVYRNGGSVLMEQLWAVPHDSLLVVGTSAHGLLKELLFGSFMEEVQAVMPNPMLIVGPESM